MTNEKQDTIRIPYAQAITIYEGIKTLAQSRTEGLSVVALFVFDDYAEAYGDHASRLSTAATLQEPGIVDEALYDNGVPTTRFRIPVDQAPRLITSLTEAGYAVFEFHVTTDDDGTATRIEPPEPAQKLDLSGAMLTRTLVNPSHVDTGEPYMTFAGAFSYAHKGQVRIARTVSGVVQTDDPLEITKTIGLYAELPFFTGDEADLWVSRPEMLGDTGDGIDATHAYEIEFTQPCRNGCPDEWHVAGAVTFAPTKKPMLSSDLSAKPHLS